MRATALYYPYFIPQDDAWIASALLWWEELYLIWPEGISTSNPVVQELIKLKAILTTDPSYEAIFNAPEFLEEVLQPNMSSIVKAPPSFSESIGLHRAKLGPLTDYLDSMEHDYGQRYIVSPDNYVHLDKNIEVPYMSFLADKLAEDPMHAYPASPADAVTDDENYLQYFGKVRIVVDDDIPRDRSEADQAVLLTLKDVVLEFDEFSLDNVEDLVKFRERNIEERQQFRDHMAELFASIKHASQLKGDDRIDVVQEASSKLKAGLADLEKQIKGTKLRTRFQDLGALVVGIMSSAGGPLVAGGVIVIGIGFSELSARHQIRETIELSPLTYLYKAKKSLSRSGWLSRLKNRGHR